MVERVLARRKSSRHSEEPEGSGKDAGTKTRVRKLENKRMIPYSVWLSPEAYAALKEKGQSRQASKLVRDAIEMIIAGNTEFVSGYKQGIKDAINIIHKDKLAVSVSVNDRKISDSLIDQIEGLIK
jgi:hypothetical protein